MTNHATNANNNKCPFKPREGYTTAAVHKESCRHNPEIKATDVSNEYALMADTDHNQPLYFWQLYSLIGQKPIIDLVTDFYRRVYADQDPKYQWFKKAFTELAPLDHHIATQTAYWIDAMGGGRVYHGGNYRLSFHHTHNARQVMTAAGAKRWMFHMRGALEAARFDDPRVKPCIIEFLKTKMMSYAQEFGWDFDESDMELYQVDEDKTQSLP